MNGEQLFKTSSNINQIQSISESLQSISRQLDSLYIGKVQYLEGKLQDGENDRNEKIYSEMELVGGFESEAFRNLYNAFLYIEKLSKF